MKKLINLTPFTPTEWADKAASIHGWKYAYRVALQCQKVPNAYWAKVSEYIKANAPAGALQEQDS